MKLLLLVNAGELGARLRPLANESPGQRLHHHETGHPGKDARVISMPVMTTENSKHKDAHCATDAAPLSV